MQGGKAERIPPISSLRGGGLRFAHPPYDPGLRGTGSDLYTLEDQYNTKLESARVYLVQNLRGMEAAERRFRDAHTISQHAQGRISHTETVGKHLLGIEQVPRLA